MQKYLLQEACTRAIVPYFEVMEFTRQLGYLRLVASEHYENCEFQK
ncbi:MAG: hypothetical protein ICV66_11495 [Chitinophagaceae bacterium]|nr:hypothetical protein [Chitinophagaceae bacterium]